MNDIYETQIAIEKNRFLLEDYTLFALTSDIGGTKTPLAVFGKRKDGKIERIFTLRWRSIEIKSMIDCINEALKYAYEEYKISAEKMHAALGVAGPVEKNRSFAKPTNLTWHVDAQEIKSGSFLKNIVILNDFEIIGYGIDLLDKKDLIQLNDAVPESKSTAAVIGAGTGLGMAILHYDKKKALHIPLASEGGHMTLPIEDEEDFKLAEFIKKKKMFYNAPGYEPFVSGPGLINIYEYFASQKFFKGKTHKNISKAYDKASEIAKNCRTDKLCRTAMDSFLKYYGRAASNLALTTYSKGGVYIAGGIAPKIIDEMQNRVFMREFEKNYRKKEILEKVPVFVVMDPDVGLLGAANAALNFFEDLIE